MHQSIRVANALLVLRPMENRYDTLLSQRRFILSTKMYGLLYQFFSSVHLFDFVPNIRGISIITGAFQPGIF